ncbi:hypothetical protein QE152_g6120 [Popillia japonica]|uniref:Uncharacterized protein n=1 Tax=Popillia japonica TaxID=7064 RepID=A0AAW1MIW4_POPJA
MIVSSTNIPYKDIHKDKRATISILDVKTIKGACCGSDHVLQDQEPANTLDIERIKVPEIQRIFEREITRKSSEPEPQ